MKIGLFILEYGFRQNIKSICSEFFCCFFQRSLELFVWVIEFQESRVLIFLFVKLDNYDNYYINYFEE